MKKLPNENIHTYSQIIDSHFHIKAMEELGLKLEEIDLSPEQFRGLDIATSHKDFQWRLDKIKNYPNIRLTAGIHPSVISHELNFKELKVAYREIEEQLQNKKVLAVGECGLDFYHDKEKKSKDLQIEGFTKQIELSIKYNVPIIIHTREATEEIIPILMQYNLLSGGIFHCFSGDKSLIEYFLPCGFYFSFAGNVTFKNATSLREALNLIPLDRLLIETDSPYLAPHPIRGRICHPGYIGYTLDCIAQEYGIDSQKLAEQLNQNFYTLFPKFTS